MSACGCSRPQRHRCVVDGDTRNLRQQDGRCGRADVALAAAAAGHGAAGHGRVNLVGQLERPGRVVRVPLASLQRVGDALRPCRRAHPLHLRGDEGRRRSLHPLARGRPRHQGPAGRRQHDIRARPKEAPLRAGPPAGACAQSAGDPFDSHLRRTCPCSRARSRSSGSRRSCTRSSGSRSLLHPQRRPRRPSPPRRRRPLRLLHRRPRRLPSPRPIVRRPSTSSRLSARATAPFAARSPRRRAQARACTSQRAPTATTAFSSSTASAPSATGRAACCRRPTRPVRP